jgi:hypothetical protein
VTPSVGHVVTCVAAPFHDRFFPVSFSFHLSSFPMLLCRLAHPWIICPCSRFIITHVFQFPLGAPVGSSCCFMFRTRYLGYLYNMYSWLSCTVVLISTLFSLATLFPFEFDSPLAPHPSVLPRAGLGQAGFASGSETTRNPQALILSPCSPRPET